MRQSETGLFPALQAALKAAKEPLDAHALFDMDAVKKHAASVNRVSDYLGNLWRKGMVVRLPAPREGSSKSRWMYEWKGHKGPALYGIEHVPNILADRPSMLIREDGSDVIIELENLIVRIQQKFKN